MSTIRSLILLSLCFAVCAAAQPAVTGVANAATNILGGLPNSPLAEGSIAVAFGNNLGPADIVVASGLPWPTTLAGTSAQIVASNQTIDLPIYYTSAKQIAFLVPSSTPVGGGSIHVTYNGQTSANFAIGTSGRNVGIFTVDSTGSGPAIVTFPDYSLVSNTKDANCGGPNTRCGAANPGQTLILWATGLGPVTGDETTTPLPGDMTSIPLKVWIGGISAEIVYRGRSGCCIGEDQIIFVVPSGVYGCKVPIATQINNGVSNFATIPIVQSGTSCPASSSIVSSDILSQLSNSPALAIGFVELKRQPDDNADRAEAAFVKFNASGQLFVDAVDENPVGTCTVSPYFNASGPPEQDPFSTLPFSFLDAGSTLTLNGNGHSVPFARSSDGDYGGRLGNLGTVLTPGAYTVVGTGGANVGAFSTNVTIPQPFLWNNRPLNGSVARTNGLVVNWTGGGSSGTVVIGGSAGTLSAPNTNVAFAGARFNCIAPASAGTFTIPPAVLLSLPIAPGNPNPNRPYFGEIDVGFQSAAVPLLAPGIDGGVVFYDESLPQVPVAFQ